MIYLKYIWWKTCRNKINNTFTNFLSKTSSQTWATKVNKSLYFGTEGVYGKVYTVCSLVKIEFLLCISYTVIWKIYVLAYNILQHATVQRFLDCQSQGRDWKQRIKTRRCKPQTHRKASSKYDIDISKGIFDFQNLILQFVVVVWLSSECTQCIGSIVTEERYSSLSAMFHLLVNNTFVSEQISHQQIGSPMPTNNLTPKANHVCHVRLTYQSTILLSQNKSVTGR
jgi:hypothetical protein